jgi:hypothetical protein
MTRFTKPKYRLAIALLAGVLFLVISYITLSGLNTYNAPRQFNFAVIGDYGFYKENPESVKQVAGLVKSWKPDFIVTLGDNNYPGGYPDDIDDNVGQFYSDYIYPYAGKYGNGNPDQENAFFPTIGNHDRLYERGQAYFDYFSLHFDNDRYYDIRKGPVHLLFLDTTFSDLRKKESKQAEWTRNLLRNSDARWKLVIMHHPPHSSSTRDTFADIRWNFRDWGVTSVIAGHEHFYERIDNNGVPYFINGLGGAGTHDFGKIMNQRGASSVVRYNKLHGAMRVTGDDSRITFEFININGKIVDSYQIQSE